MTPIRAVALAAFVTQLYYNNRKKDRGGEGRSWIGMEGKKIKYKALFQHFKNEVSEMICA